MLPLGGLKLSEELDICIDKAEGLPLLLLPVDAKVCSLLMATLWLSEDGEFEMDEGGGPTLLLERIAVG